MGSEMCIRDSSNCVLVANDCERLPALDKSQRDSNARSDLVAVRLKRLVRLNETKLLYYSKTVNGGFATCHIRIIDFTNFCHFLRNNDSKYCFFSCNRCSLRLKSGHLLTFRATFIFLHRASKALSRAANSFMLVSWSRLLRNIHS